MEIIVGGIVGAGMFVLVLWRVKADLTTAFFLFCGLAGVTFLGIWAAPLVIQVIVRAGDLAGWIVDILTRYPQYVALGSYCLAMFLIALFAAPGGD